MLFMLYVKDEKKKLIACCRVLPSQTLGFRHEWLQGNIELREFFEGFSDAFQIFFHMIVKILHR